MIQQKRKLPEVPALSSNLYKGKKKVRVEQQKEKEDKQEIKRYSN